MSTVLSSIGPYRLLRALGRGANGDVYLAEDVRLGRKVAVKTLSAVDSQGLSEARRWMLREARAAARLNHPHIASVYDVVESPGGAHIVMEYVRGQTLAARLRDRELPPEEVLAIGVQLTEALAEAHGMGVVHRDLKPANVVLTPKGDIKILDFGLAQVRPIEPGSTPSSSSRDFTLQGQQVGTPPYMPPEHLLGDPVDVRGDIYSLGVMLYELLTGRRPFSGADSLKLAAAILTEPTPRAGDDNPAVPKALDEVVFRAMSRRPEDRYQSAAEMGAALRHVAASTPMALPDAVTVSRRVGPASTARRRRRAAAVLVAGLLVGSATYIAIQRNAPAPGRPAGPPVVAVLPLAAVGGDAASIAIGLADSLVSSLARTPGMTVISRAATVPYADRKKGMDVIARELGLTAVLDGRVQQVGRDLRVTLSLVPAGSNRVAWSNSYDGTEADILTIQSRAAQEVAEALTVELSPKDRARIQQPPTRNLEAYGDYAQARTFLDRRDVKGNIDRSITLFESALARDPKFARAFAGLGEAEWRKYLDTRETAWSIKARDAILEALRLDPDDAEVRYTLAGLYSDTGRTAEAIEQLKKALELQPSNDDAHRRLGQVLAESGEQAQALAEFETAIKIRPGFWRNYLQLGLADMKAGRNDEAVAAFRRITQLQPDNAWGFQMLGTAYHVMGDRAAAVTNYQRAIELGPDARAYSNLGTAYYEDGRFADAARAYEQAAQMEPKVPAKHRNLGDVYKRLGQPEKARDAYRRAIALGRDQLQTNPRDAGMLAFIAVCEAKLGDGAAARQHVAEALALTPGSGDVLYRKAVVYALTGQAKESLVALRAALAHGASAATAKSDEDLSVLRGTPDYEKVINEAATSK